MHYSTPEAHITVRKSRVKNYSGSCYLTPKTEFEIELYNPTTNKICAKISINGRSSNTALIIRPGERVFLERYLDEARRFKFDTYFVDGSSETKSAIRDNGGISVSFHREYIPIATPPIYNQTINFNNTGGYVPILRSVPNNYPIYGNGMDFNGQNPMFTQTSSSSDNVNYSDCSSKVSFSSSDNDSGITTDELKRNLIDEVNLRQKASDNSFARRVETGRVEKGSVSDQNFQMVNESYQVYAFHSITLKVLPISQEPEAVQYCSECGRRARQKENFCPKCGTRISS